MPSRCAGAAPIIGRDGATLVIHVLAPVEEQAGMHEDHGFFDEWEGDADALENNGIRSTRRLGRDYEEQAGIHADKRNRPRRQRHE